MDCAICFEAIGGARTTLACAHTFHINCIVGWFYQQNLNGELGPEEYEAGQTSSSCPCCRAVPANPLDDIPSSRLILFQEDGSDDGSSVTLDNPFAEDEELTTEPPRRADTPPPPPVPRLDLTRLQVRWERTGSTSWERQVLVEEEEVSATEAWDGARTPSPPPDSLVQQTMDAARAIQHAFRAHRVP
jgi:hypothetical protein